MTEEGCPNCCFAVLVVKGREKLHCSTASQREKVERTSQNQPPTVLAIQHFTLIGLLICLYFVLFPFKINIFLSNIGTPVNFVIFFDKYLHFHQDCQRFCQIFVFPSTLSVFLSNICISLPSLECRRIGRAAVLRLQMSSSCRSGLNTNHHIKKGHFF